MGLWSPAFQQRMLLGGEPMYAVDFASSELVSTPRLTDNRYILHSHGGGSGSEHIGHAIQRVTGGGQSVSLRTWKSSQGRLRVELSGADIAQFVAKAIPRGMIAQLKIGFQGMTFDEFEPVGLYQYRNLSGSRSSWVMDFNDIFGALQSANSSYLSGNFMWQAGRSTVATSNWSVGSPSPATLTVDDITGFAMDSATSARGLLYVPSPYTGDPFYLKYSGILTGAKQLNIVDTDVLGTSRGTISSTRLDEIVSVGYVQAELPDVVQKLLFGGIGGSSTMPDAWNLGLNWSSDTVNSGDFNIWRSKFIERFTPFEPDFIATDPIVNPYRAIEDFMAAFGSWLVVKEGRLSWRFVQRLVPHDGIGERFILDRTITDQDIAGERTYQLYHPDCPSEYYQTFFGGHGAYFSDGAVVDTEPGLFRLNHESENWVYNDDRFANNNENAFLNIRTRIGPWYTRVPDSLSLTLAGWRHADLVPGDVVLIDSAYVRNMVNYNTLPGGIVGADLSGKYHNGTPYMVTAVDVDWDGFTVDVELSTPPQSNVRYT